MFLWVCIFGDDGVCTFFDDALPGGEIAGREAVEVAGVEVRAQAVEDEHEAGVGFGGCGVEGGG